MTDDSEDDLEHNDPLPAHVKRRRSQLFSSKNSPVKGSLKTVLARAKGRKQKVSLPSIELKRT